MTTEPEICTRIKAEIGGENYYIMVGDKFVMATVPHENRPDQQKMRGIVDQICETITEGMELHAKKNQDT